LRGRIECQCCGKSAHSRRIFGTEIVCGSPYNPLENTVDAGSWRCHGHRLRSWLTFGPWPNSKL
jgi:hypothetical protein